MPTLLQLNCGANWGSTGKIAEGIGLVAMSRGWESYIAYGREDFLNPSASKLIKVGSRIGNIVHYGYQRFFDAEGLGSPFATRKLIKAIERVQPDIISLHNIHDHWLNYPSLFKYLETIDIPIFWTFHDCWAFTGGCPHFVTINCEQWKTDCGACPMNRGVFNRASKNFKLRSRIAERFCNRLHIVSVSNWMDSLVGQSIYRNSHHSVIYNGIDISAFSTDGNKNNQCRSILGVSNVWNDAKGLGDFIILRDLLPSDIGITLVGLTEAQIRSLPEGIKGITRTQNVAELADIYRQATVFVNPTYNDSFPTVNLEALACGTPVVTYRTGGSPEAVDEKTGIVVEKGDLNALVHSINEILNHPEKYNNTNCRKRAETHFNKDIQFTKYIDLYEEILNQTI